MNSLTLFASALGLGFSILIASAGLPGAIAKGQSCDAYDVVFRFKFSGSDTTGCVGIGRDALAAGGEARYEDTYCGGRSSTASVTASGSRITFPQFRYSGCGGQGATNKAEIAVIGVKPDGDCFSFTRLDFVWLLPPAKRDPYEARPFGEPPTTCRPLS